MARPRLRWFAPLLAVVAPVLVVVAFWSTDTVRARGRVPRHVSVAGADVSGLGGDELRARVAGLADRFAALPVTVQAVSADGVERRELTATAAEMGLAVDQAATASQAQHANRPGGFPLMAWFRSFRGSADVTPVVTVADGAALQAAARFSTATAIAVVEPTIVLREGALAATPATTGVGLDPAAVVEALRPVRYTTAPIALSVPLTRTPPQRDPAAVQAYVDQANALTAQPVTLKAGSATMAVAPTTLRSWVQLPADANLAVALDDTRVAPAIAKALAATNRKPVDASIALQGGQPVIKGGNEGRTCCAPEATAVVQPALDKRAGGGPAAVEVPVVKKAPAVTRASIEALGIVQPVASFTTSHNCCEARVQNIHRMADLVQGYVIKPGQTLSINKFVGRRTADKGFVPAPAIIDGALGDQELGGGISQYMTTLFNASWFAGLNFGEYSSHSIYISRYPYGREATVNYPHPDLQVKNNLPYGVLVQNTYTDTSVTVTIWSTKVFSSVEQTAQSKYPNGVGCTGVKTSRTLTYVDGRTKVDSTRASYRTTPGINCDGQPAKKDEG